MKIILYVLIAIVQLVAAFVCLFILLLGLNGFSERQATPSLIFFIVLSLVIVLGDGALGIWLTRILSMKLGVGRASVMGTIGAVIFGVIVLIGGLFVAFALAEVVRGMK